MLCARAMIVIDVLLNLRLLLALGGLVDGHLDVLVVVRHHYRTQGGVLSVHDAVVHRPEAVEVEGLLVVLHGRFHQVVGLVAHHVVDLLEADGGHQLVEVFGEVVRLVSGQERALVVLPLHEGVDGVPVGLDGRQNNNSVLVRQLIRRTHRHAPILDGVRVDGPRVLDGEGDVPDAVAVLDEVVVHLRRGVPVVDGAEDEGGALVIADHVADHGPVAGLQSLVGQVLEAEAGGVVGGGLLGVSHPEHDVVSDYASSTETQDFAEGWSFCLAFHALKLIINSRQHWTNINSPLYQQSYQRHSIFYLRKLRESTQRVISASWSDRISSTKELRIGVQVINFLVQTILKRPNFPWTVLNQPLFSLEIAFSISILIPQISYFLFDIYSRYAISIIQNAQLDLHSFIAIKQSKSFTGHFIIGILENGASWKNFTHAMLLLPCPLEASRYFFYKFCLPV